MSEAVAAEKAPAVCPNGRHRSANYRVVSKGIRRSAAGADHRYLCVSKAGKSHSFSIPVAAAPAKDKRRKDHGVVCPDPRHRDARIQSRGTVKTATGTWRRFLCSRPTGDRHYFRIQETAAGTARATVERPPACPDHPDSKVVRNGTFGRSPKAKKPNGPKRQRYRCEPVEGKVHYFSPALSREAVSPGESCSTCDELLSPHRGALTAARHTPWTLPGIVQALNDLSLGSSYATVSLQLRAQHALAVEHLLTAHGFEMTLPSGPSSKSDSWTRTRGQNAWHLAASLVEQYAPLLLSTVTDSLVAREQEARAVNDAALAADPGAVLAHPIVYILDELPVEFHKKRSDRTRYQQDSWSLLVVVELLWHPSSDGITLPQREPRLRLARAYPRGNEEAWRLVLHELPVRPDFVVADASDAITNAVNTQYGTEVVPIVPSLFHTQRNIRAMLLKLPGATKSSDGRTVLVDSLDKHLSLVTRDELLGMTVGDLRDWWDELVERVKDLPAPTSAVLESRKIHEDRMANAISLLTKHPQLPASNAAVESRIRLTLDPFLENRKHRYRNLARTNFLFDLAVCRAQGAFNDLNRVALLIREGNEAARGWAPTPRALTDTQPSLSLPSGQPAPLYSSLLNPLLIPALLASRGMPPTPPKTGRNKQLSAMNAASAAKRAQKSTTKAKAKPKPKGKPTP